MFEKVCAFLVVLVAMVSSVKADIIEVDDTLTGIEAVTFNPGEFVMPLLGALAAIITAVAVVKFAPIVWKWLLNFVRSR
jgi:hypothetical protein